MKRAIIGGAGFIGINLAQYYLEKGESITIFDNFSRRGTTDNVNWIKSKYPRVSILQGDIRIDQEKLKHLMETHDIIYHLAGQVAVTTSVTNPREDFEINALGTFNVLEAARSVSKPPILFYSSTNKVYGGMEDINIVEIISCAPELLIFIKKEDLLKVLNVINNLENIFKNVH